MNNSSSSSASRQERVNSDVELLARFAKNETFQALIEAPLGFKGEGERYFLH